MHEEINFKYELINSIPVLSWIMKVTSFKDVLVKHGSMVECKSSFFVSGVWAGDFETGDFINTTFSCCSGASSYCIDNNFVIVVSTPSHLQETLYMYRDENALLFSNSLPFLLKETGKVLNPDYYNYEQDLCSIIYGEKKLINQIKLKEDKTIIMFRNSNIFIRNDLSFRSVSKSIHNRFKDFNDYYCYLRSVLSKIVNNSIDNHRIHRYGMISTISRGYDAPAVSVMAHEMGCVETMTMREPYYDNGKSIAIQLGYKKVYEIERDDYKRSDYLLEAEAAAVGLVGGLIFESNERICSGKLIFMGTRGDSVWGRSQKYVNEDLAFPYNGYAQASLSPIEHLLRINSIVIHVPLIGADSWPDIVAISNSPEMKPWAIGGNYDRPIARRIVEEKGVHREDFGQHKYGAGISFHFNTFNNLKNKMSLNSYESLLAYKNNLKRKRIKDIINRINFLISEFPVYFNVLSTKLNIRFYLNEQSKGRKSSPIANLMILWGIHEMTKRY